MRKATPRPIREGTHDISVREVHLPGHRRPHPVQACAAPTRRYDGPGPIHPCVAVSAVPHPTGISTAAPSIESQSLPIRIRPPSATNWSRASVRRRSRPRRNAPAHPSCTKPDYHTQTGTIERGPAPTSMRSTPNVPVTLSRGRLQRAISTVDSDREDVGGVSQPGWMRREVFRHGRRMQCQSRHRAAPSIISARRQPLPVSTATV